MSLLFTPAKIGSLELPNRFVRSATAENMADENGFPKPELARLYENLALGGVGLIISGHMYIHPGGKAHPEMTGIYTDDQVAPLAQLAEAAHRRGGKLVAQLNHGGMQCAAGTVADPIAPSSVQPPLADAPSREMRVDEIMEVIEAFSQSARRAKQAGFDGVQIHAAHGYLVSEFLSPLTNRRTGEWGGSFENRLRFLRRVSQAVRQQVGPGYPVLIKLGMVDGPQGGLSLADGARIVAELEGMGIDGLEISSGIDGEGLNSIRKAVLKPEQEGYFRPLARLARPATRLPILLVGGFRSQRIMEETLQNGEADFISLCRPLISEPDLPKRFEQGLQPRSTCMSGGLCFPNNEGEGIACRCNRTLFLREIGKLPAS